MERQSNEWYRQQAAEILAAAVLPHGKVEIAEAADVSKGFTDNGAWVQAWVYVPGSTPTPKESS